MNGVFHFIDINNDETYSQIEPIYLFKDKNLDSAIYEEYFVQFFENWIFEYEELKDKIFDLIYNKSTESQRKKYYYDDIYYCFQLQLSEEIVNVFDIELIIKEFFELNNIDIGTYRNGYSVYYYKEKNSDLYKNTYDIETKYCKYSLDKEQNIKIEIGAD